jgi:hypothetical protein
MTKIPNLPRILSYLGFIALIVSIVVALNMALFELDVEAFPQEEKEINLLKESPNAVWSSSYGRLRFGGSRDNPHGFAIYRKGLLLEDNSSAPIVLETHPRWAENGFIRGEFFIPGVKTGQHLKTSIGFIKPAGTPRTNGVKVKIIFNNVTLYNNIKHYTGELEEISIDMSQFDKTSGTLILEVGANGDSNQDWLVWKNTTIGYP